MTNNMRSTLISDEYLEAILKTTLDEIISAMRVVFGPRGTDIFITSNKNSQLYLTRDGKEVFNSLRFDNVLAEQIKMMIGNAVDTQADVIGDSTTTVGLITPMIAKEFREYINSPDNGVNIFDSKKAAKKVIRELKNYISMEAVPMEYGSELHKAMLYTTTGDTEFIDMILSNIDDIKADSIIDVQLNELVSETTFEVSGIPKIKSSILYSKKPLKKDPKEDYYQLNDSVILFVDGSLSFYKYQTFALLSMLSFFQIKNVIIYCASIDKITNDTLRQYQSEFVANLPENVSKALANIVIMRLPEYMSMSKDEIIDLNSIFYDDARDLGINKPLDFEHKIYHALYKIFKDEYLIKGIIDNNGDSVINKIIDVQDYLIYDGDEELIGIIERTMLRLMNVEISNSDTLLPINETQAKKTRMELINRAMEKSRSIIEKNALSKRLSRFYSSKIIVKIGSDKLSEAQKETELLLDALKATQRAVKNGVIKTNGLSLIETMIKGRYSHIHNRYEKIFIDILHKVIVCNILPHIYTSEADYGKIFIADDYFESFYDEKSNTELYVVEPVDAILKVLDAVELGIDIACSKVFTANGFLSNFI